MKRCIKAALPFILCMALVSSCASSGSRKDAEKGEDTAETTAPVSDDPGESVEKTGSSDDVKDVTEADASIGKLTGKYTGKVKGETAVGKAELYLNADEYFIGIWTDGKLCGECEYFFSAENGDDIFYSGICKDFIPSGTGHLERAYKNDDLIIYQDGYFSEGLTGVVDCYITDYDGQLIDIGYTEDNTFFSYIGNEDYSGMSYCYEYGEDGTTELFPGFYIGQINDDGVPQGYGFFRSRDIKNENGLTSVEYCIGSWKDGKPEGKSIRFFTDGITASETVSDTGKDDITVPIEGDGTDGSLYKAMFSAAGELFAESEHKELFDTLNEVNKYVGGEDFVAVIK